MPELILASTSPHRRALLERLRVPFSVIAPGVDESDRVRESPADRAARLALEKAQAVSRAHPDALVIGSDQVAAQDQRVLHKPLNAAVCRAQLLGASGSSVRFHTGCAALCMRDATRVLHLDTTTVVFRALETSQIDRYIESEQPFDCAGGFRAEGLGIALFERIESVDPTALIGLPLIWLAEVLRRAGWRVP
jgi:septum formation protein